MKKTVLGFFVAICSLIIGVVTTTYVQDVSLPNLEENLTSVEEISPLFVSRIAYSDFYKLKDNKTISVRARLIWGNCLNPSDIGYTAERRASCLRDAEKSLCVNLIEADYPLKYDVAKYGFDTKSAQRALFVKNPKTFLNAKPSWFDGTTEVIVTGRLTNVRKRLSEDNQGYKCYLGSGSLFEICNVEELPTTNEYLSD